MSLICFDQCDLGWAIEQIKSILTIVLGRLSDTDLSEKLPEVQTLLLDLCGETDTCNVLVFIGVELIFSRHLPLAIAGGVQMALVVPKQVLFVITLYH